MRPAPKSLDAPQGYADEQATTYRWRVGDGRDGIAARGSANEKEAGYDQPHPHRLLH